MNEFHGGIPQQNSAACALLWWAAGLPGFLPSLAGDVELLRSVSILREAARSNTTSELWARNHARLLRPPCVFAPGSASQLGP